MISINSFLIREGDLSLPFFQEAFLRLLNAYHQDVMGAGEPYPDVLKERVLKGLLQSPGAFVLIAMTDQNQPAGMAVCFTGFSTFSAQPLVNIHDLIVLPEFRRQGAAQALLAGVRDRVTKLGGCKITLEVRVDNENAQNLYRSLGFEESDPPMLFWHQKVGQGTQKENIL